MENEKEVCSCECSCKCCDGCTCSAENAGSDARSCCMPHPHEGSNALPLFFLGAAAFGLALLLWRHDGVRKGAKDGLRQAKKTASPLVDEAVKKSSKLAEKSAKKAEKLGKDAQAKFSSKFQ